MYRNIFILGDDPSYLGKTFFMLSLIPSRQKDIWAQNIFVVSYSTLRLIEP
jgi:hypothetical protein